MKVSKTFSLLSTLLFIFVIAFSVRGQTGITINNADSVLGKNSSIFNSSFDVLLNQVSSRVVLEFANSGQNKMFPPFNIIN